jgi:hypothetical protein
MGSRFGSQCGDPDWDPLSDINADCVLNIQDLAIGGGNFGRECPGVCISAEQGSVAGVCRSLSQAGVSFGRLLGAREERPWL